MRRSAHILLEGTPDWLDLEELRAELIAVVPEVHEVHHVHAWLLTSERPLMTLHARVREGADHHEVLLAIGRFLEHRFGIGHATVQIEAPGCPDTLRDAPSLSPAGRYTNRAKS